MAVKYNNFNCSIEDLEALFRNWYMDLMDNK